MLQPRKLSLILVTALAAVVFAGCSLAEDITPPPNYRPPATSAPRQPVSASTVYPLVPPDPAQGKPIYAQKCEPCHGPGGRGDGSMSANLSSPPAPIGSPELARNARPSDWFHIVTTGNLERFMPGFSESLNDRERWDVVAYVYTLSMTQAELAQGQAAYVANCAACHGETGKGDGPQAVSQASKPISWDDQSRLTRLSANEIVTVITSGNAPGLTTSHPTFAEILPDPAERSALATYIRSMSFAQTGRPVESAAQGQVAQATPPAGEATPAATSVPPLDGTPVSPTLAAEDSLLTEVTISGQVVNTTPGSQPPASGMQARLRVFEGMGPAFEEVVDVGPDARYVFENVAYSPSYIYLVQVAANGLVFNSDIVHGRDISNGSLDLPVEVYDTTQDASVLRADRLHVFFDFGRPGRVQVVNLYIISNPTEKVVTGPNGEAPVINFELPQGYENLQFQDGEIGGRFVQTETGFGDRMAVFPGTGEQQILFAYDLPYDKRLTLDLKVPMPVEAATVMMPQSGVKLKADQLTDAGQRNVQGTSFQMYQSAGTIEAGSAINLGLSGAASIAGASSVDQNSNMYLLVGLGAFGLALMGAGYWFYRQRSAEAEEDEEALEFEGAETSESSESLLDAIVALDDLHASGKLPEEAYQERRAELKARLAEAMAAESSARTPDSSLTE